MSVFGGGGKKTSQSQAPTAVSALTVQTSTQGAVIPVVYGTQRVSGNLIWYDDFAAHAHSSGGGGGGGKGGGGGGGGGGSTSYTYSASFAFGIAAGKIVEIGNIWWEKNNYCMATVPASAQRKLGHSEQTPWSYLTSNHPGKDLAYPGLAYIGMASTDLGDSANMPNIGYEVVGQGPVAAYTDITKISYTMDLSPLTASVSDAKVQGIVSAIGAAPAPGGNKAFDTSPAFCLYDLLTNAAYGSGFPATRVGDLGDYARWCQAMGISMSVSLDKAQEARAVIQDWLKFTLAQAVWSGGLLRIVPYADQTLTGTGADGSSITYTPNMTPVMSIDDSLMLITSENTPPLTVTRKDPSDAKNRVTLEYADRSNAYSKTIVTADALAHIDAYGLRPEGNVTAHHFTTGAVAQRVADLLVNRYTNVVAAYEWRMGALAALLEPMDIVALTDELQGLSETPVRIIEIEEEDDTVFRITAEAVPGAIAVAVERPLQPSLGYAADRGVDPGDVNLPVMFEPPEALASTGLELWVALSGGDDWGGANIWVSEDGATYAQIGTVRAKARQGILSEALPSGSASDQTNALAVNLSMSGAALSSGTAQDAASLNTLCYVDGELLAYQTATLTDSSCYLLRNLVRGAYGSTIASHAAGSQFARLDGAIFKYPFKASQIGRSLKLKFTSFNIWGASEQDISEVQAYDVTVIGSALAYELPDVSGLTTAYVSGIAQLVWNPVADSRSFDYEIRRGASWNSGVVVTRSSQTQTPCLGDGTYWVAAHVMVSDSYDIYSPNPTSVVVTGAQLVSNVVVSHDEAALGWGGHFDNAVLLGSSVELVAAGDLLNVANAKLLDDVLYYGGVAASGSYTIPSSRRIDVGRVTTCNVAVSVSAHGRPSSQNLLTMTDLMPLTDVCGINLGPNVSVTPQIRTSADSSTWSDWKSWVAGAYSGRYFDFRVLLESADPSVVPSLSGFTYLVDMPDRVDSFTALSVPAAGLQINFTAGLSGNPAAAFIGGPNGKAVPNVLVTVLNGNAGDVPVISGLTSSGFFVQVFNNGSAVARTVNIIAQGY